MNKLTVMIEPEMRAALGRRAAKTGTTMRHLVREVAQFLAMDAAVRHVKDGTEEASEIKTPASVAEPDRGRT